MQLGSVKAAGYFFLMHEDDVSGSDEWAVRSIRDREAMERAFVAARSRLQLTLQEGEELEHRLQPALEELRRSVESAERENLAYWIMLNRRWRRLRRRWRRAGV